MQKDLVSIIVPVYNVGKFLPDCFKSIENQTYKNIEVVFVNDGSTDNSKDLIEQFCKEHDYAKIINQENKGLAAARNTGFSNINGEFIYFLDSDDLIHPEVIKQYHEWIIENNCDVVWGGIKHIKENANYNQVNFRKISKKLIKISDKDTLICKYLGARIGVTNKLFRTAIFQSIEGWPNIANEKIVMGEDVYLMTKYLIHANTGVINKSNTYYWRERGSSLVHKPFYEELFTTMVCMSPLEEFDSLSDLKQTQIYIKALKSVFAFYLLYRIKNSNYYSNEKVDKLYSIFKANIKYAKKCKYMIWYIKHLFKFSKPVAKYYYKKISKRKKDSV